MAVVWGDCMNETCGESRGGILPDIRTSKATNHKKHDDLKKKLYKILNIKNLHVTKKMFD
jgi:hypothetical protein